MSARRARLAWALLLAATPLTAQSYRARLDMQAQTVSFRGLELDSIAANEVVLSPGGGVETPDGYAVRCAGGSFCFFLRPGDAVRSLPFSTSGSIAFWGLGVPGLALHATGRVVSDLGRDEVWPGTDPAAQLLEGYLEYRRSALVARAGRQLVSSRLEPIGFDGAWIRGRSERTAIEVTGYGGWGLGQAAVVAAQSPSLNPLDEWRPRDRQLVAGGEASWSHQYADVRAEYRREMDPLDDYLVSERAALSFGARASSFRADGGIDFNLAEGRLGSTDLVISYVSPQLTLAAGARRYQPYFSLWTLWGAFSPVPYRSFTASLQWRPTPWIILHGRGERYRYSSTEASTALVTGLENRGWRLGGGGTALLGKEWTFVSTAGLEHGPGAAGRFADLALTFAPDDRLSIDVYGGTLARPLELRFLDATSRWIGGRAAWNVTPQRRVWADAALVEDARDRPDAAASSLDQVRGRLGLSLAFGSADRLPLPPARRTTR